MHRAGPAPRPAPPASSKDQPAGLRKDSGSIPATSARAYVTSVLTSDNAVILVVVTASVVYLGVQAVRRRAHDRRQLERKHRLLGVTAATSSSSASTSSSAASTSAAAEPLPSRSHPPVALAALCAALAHHLRLVQLGNLLLDALPASARRYFTNSSASKRRRRKQTSSAGSDGQTQASLSAVSANASAGEQRGRANTAGGTTGKDKTSNATSSKSPSQSATGASLPNVTSTPSRAVSSSSPSTTSSPKAPSNPRHNSSASRSRSSTNAIKQNSSKSIPLAKPSVVLKHVGVQATSEEDRAREMALEGAAGRAEQDQIPTTTTNPSTPVQPRRKSKRPQLTPSKRSPSPLRQIDSRTLFEVACATALPAQIEDLDSSSADEALQRIRPAPSLDRHATIKRASPRSPYFPTTANERQSSGLSQQRETSAPEAPRVEKRDSIQSTSTNADSRSGACSGRSTSLSISTDATASTLLSSLHSDTDEMMPMMSSPKVATNRGQPNGPSGEQEGKTPPSYSFHSSFQEPTLEDGEDETQSHLGDEQTQHNSAQTAPTSMYLPTPPDSERRIRTDALGYPCILPDPPSASGSPASSRRAPSTNRRDSHHLPQQSISSPPTLSRSNQQNVYPRSMPEQPLYAQGYSPGLLQNGADVTQQQHAQMQQYIIQAQYQYQQLLMQQQHQHTNQYQHQHLRSPQHPSFPGNQQLHAHSSHGPLHPSLPPSPAMFPQASPGLLGPSHHSSVHGHGAPLNGHQSHPSVSSRSASPQPSLHLPTSSFPSLHSSNGYGEDAHAHGTSSSNVQQTMASPVHLQQHVAPPEQQQGSLMQKMQVMQAQLQYAIQQTQVQNQALAGASPPYHAGEMGTPHRNNLPYTPISAVDVSKFAMPPMLYQQSPSQLQNQGGQQAYMFPGNVASSPIAGGSYPYQSLAAAAGQTIGSPISQAQIYSDMSAERQDNVRRRQSTPSLAGDILSAASTSYAQQHSPSPFTNGGRRSRRSSRPSRVSSYGQSSIEGVGSPAGVDFSGYDMDADVSTTSSVHGVSASKGPMQDNNRRRDSLAPPSSPLLAAKDRRRVRHRDQRDRMRQRQLELNDEEVTNNEDDIKADLEVLASMQAKDEDLSIEELKVSMKSAETVLERRSKELEIARWKLKCVEVDRRSIEAEHQKALLHFFQRAERAEARLKLLDNVSTASTETNNDSKSSPELVERSTNSSVTDSKATEDSKSANGEEGNPKTNTAIAFSSTTPHLAYSADHCFPDIDDASTYHFSSSPYTSSKYPMHPFAHEYQVTRRGRRSPRHRDGSGRSQASGEDRPANAMSSALTSPAMSVSDQPDTPSDRDSDSDDDVEIVLDSSYTRSPAISATQVRSAIPASMLDKLGPSSVSMKDNRTVGLGINSSSSGSEDMGRQSPRSQVEYVGSLPSFTISQPPIVEEQVDAASAQQP